jgi:calcineurin-like phosphoesterase family protein
MSMSETYFCSDLHLGHENVKKFREGFESVEEHDETITNRIINSTTKRDTLYILGDVCFKKESMKYLKRIADHVKSVKIVLGNHDAERGHSPSVQDYIDIGCSVHGLIKYKGFWLSHAPIHPSELRGKFNIHGHTHNIMVEDLRYMNVCVEHLGEAGVIGITDLKDEGTNRKNFIREKILKDNIDVLQSAYYMIHGQIHPDMENLQELHDGLISILSEYGDSDYSIPYTISALIKQCKSNLRQDWSEYYQKYYLEYNEWG